ncbi:MAG: Y-family DNA polymerase [Bacteriovoracaceae bacterium]|jgi:DNA polymerase V|nr:Y-family DNA polymerase [Bacteriovoracaceae bacterium]
MKKIYALVDCDAFFCNCERLFRPDLRGKPVIVLSNNDGCTVSRTIEAKALGIEMAAPYFKIQKFCEENGVYAFSSNFSLYTNISSRIMKTLSTLSPIIEYYSVDEAFLDLTGIAEPYEYAKRIRQTIAKKIGMPVSVGVAHTKVLCKVACHFAKQRPELAGVSILLDQEKQDHYLKNMSVQKLWGIGKQRAIKLRLMGIKTAKDFRDYKDIVRIQQTLTKVGRQIQDELRGHICFPLSIEIEKKKEIMSSRTFGSSVFTKEILKESIATHASEVAKELRSQRSVCMEVTVFIRSNPFKENSSQYHRSTKHCFLSPTSNTFKIINTALQCLDRIFKPGIEYKKSGVRISHFQDSAEATLSLFEPADTVKEEDLMLVMDKVNLREGKESLKSLACGLNNITWKMNQRLKSKRFTTRWHELREISCDYVALK